MSPLSIVPPPQKGGPILQGLATPRLRNAHGPGALAVFHQHVPLVGPRSADPDDVPQRRNQHFARQQKLDALPGGSAGVGLLWRRRNPAVAAGNGRQHVGQR